MTSLKISTKSLSSDVTIISRGWQHWLRPWVAVGSKTFGWPTAMQWSYWKYRQPLSDSLASLGASLGRNFAKNNSRDVSKRIFLLKDESGKTWKVLASCFCWFCGLPLSLAIFFSLPLSLSLSHFPNISLISLSFSLIIALLLNLIFFLSLYRSNYHYNSLVRLSLALLFKFPFL